MQVVYLSAYFPAACLLNLHANGGGEKALFFFAFVSDIELGSSKTLADAAAHQLLRLTSPFQRSAALLQLLRPRLVTTPPLTVADRVSGQSETVLHKHTASFFPQYGIKNAHCNQKVKAPCPPRPSTTPAPTPPGSVTSQELSESGSAFGRRFPSLLQAARCESGTKCLSYASSPRRLTRGPHL